MTHFRTCPRYHKAIILTPKAGPVLTPGYQMKKHGRGLVGDATYRISKLYAFEFHRRENLKFSFFVYMFELITPMVWGQF